MNTMNNKRKVGYVAAILANGVLYYLGATKWGDDLWWFFFGTVFITTLMNAAKYKMTRLYWKKQIWRCDTCDNVITEDADLIVTFDSGGRRMRYDKVECMRSGITGGL